jgi:hypothetical protein
MRMRNNDDVALVAIVYLFKTRGEYKRVVV